MKTCIDCERPLDKNNVYRKNKTGRCRSCSMKAIGPKKGENTRKPIAECLGCGKFNIYANNKSGFCWRCSRGMSSGMIHYRSI